METDNYSAAFDASAKLITNLFIIGALSLLAFNAMTPVGDSEIAYMGVFLLIPVLGISWGLHPQSYTIGKQAIIIKRPFQSPSIPFEQITEVKRIDRSELGFSFRLLGSGGLFGYFGVFTSTAFGRYTMWCSNKENLVLIVLNGNRIVISPSEPDRFIMNTERCRYLWKERITHN